MPEIVTINQNNQIGVETTSGTAVAANKLLESFEIVPQAKVDQAKFRKQGRRYKSIIEPGKDYTEAKITGLATYDEMVYPISALLGAATIGTAGSTSHLWTWTPPLTGSIIPKSLTVQQGDAVRARQFAYGVVTDLGMKFTRDEVTLTGMMIGQKLVDDGTPTMTASPTAIGVHSILGSQWSAYIDTTSAGIGVTQLLRVLEASFDYKGAFGPVWTGNSGITSWASLADLAPVVELKLLVEADTAGMAMLANARAGTTQYLQILCTGITIPSDSVPYQFTLQMAGRVSAEPTAYQDKEGVYAVEFTWEAIEDTTWGKSTNWILQNALASL